MFGCRFTAQGVTLFTVTRVTYRTPVPALSGRPGFTAAHRHRYPGM